MNWLHELHPGQKAERITRFGAIAIQTGERRLVRPVYCPICGRHYTTAKASTKTPWAATVVHVPCSDCGGDVSPSTLATPR